MPWSAKDAKSHTKKATGSKAKKVWAKVADNVLAKTGDEGRAVREANAVLKREKKR